MLQPIGLSFIFSGLVLLLINSVIRAKPKILNKRKNPNKICVIIPAKYESNVVGNILSDLKAQDAKVVHDIFVVLEKDDKKSIEICDKNKVSYILREKPELKTKGYALNEAFSHLNKNQKKYDIYFIFDADNRLEKNFISKMLKSYREGYDIATAYRKSTNINENRISACSALTFSMINTLSNLPKIRQGKTITLSGTGYFISDKIVQEWGGEFPFCSLTEDVEMSIYSSIKNYHMTYNQEAIFYDEQPTETSVSLKQRARWVKGYFINKTKYFHRLILKPNPSTISELIGVWPYIFFILGAILIFIDNILSAINGQDTMPMIIGELFLIYLIMVVATISMLLNDGRKLGIHPRIALQTVLFNPIFLSTYVICIFMAIFTRVSWEKIEHHGKIKTPN